MTAPGSRAVAAAALEALQSSGGFSNRVLSRALDRHPELAGRDRGFATNLFYGVLRHRGRLDALIDTVAHDPGRLPAPARTALRIGAFELRELGQPPHAAISEAVALVRSHRGGDRLAGVVQAILGRIDREGAQLDEDLEAGKPLDVLERRWSIPRWWAGRMLKQLGEEPAIRRARAFSETPALEVRVDLHRTTRASVIEQLKAEVPDATVAAAAQVDSGVTIRGGGDVFHTPLHEDGLISVQSLASQAVGSTVPVGPGLRVLDACAGLGVKTLQLAERMERAGQIVANDPDAARQDRGREVVERGRLPAGMVTFTGYDLADSWPGEFDGGFDAILVDAPCTGLGNVGRHPEIRWQREFADIAENARRQRAILQNCLRGLRPTGQLVYAVCSLEPEEGPGVVETVVADGSVRELARGQWTPEDDGGEGFFWARLGRRP